MLKRLFATRSSISRSFNYSVLTQAIASGNIDCAIAVMNDSPELINDTDKFGNSALHVAVQLESEILARELIARGANINANNSLGFSPLAWAVKIGWEAGVKLMGSAAGAMGIVHVAKNSPINFAVSENTYKKLRYKVILMFSFGFLIYLTYDYSLFFIDAKEMVDHGLHTRGVVTSIYNGTSTGRMQVHYTAATVTYLGGYKIYIDGKNLREGEGVDLTYSALRPYMAKEHSFGDSFLDFAAWRSESYLHLALYTALIALVWGIFVASFKSYLKGKPITGADLNDFFAEDKLLTRILEVTGITRLFKRLTAKPQGTQKPAVAPASTTAIRPAATQTIDNNVEDNVSDKLRQIQKLFQEGVITEAEFNEKKRELLQKL